MKRPLPAAALMVLAIGSGACNKKIAPPPPPPVVVLPKPKPVPTGKPLPAPPKVETSVPPETPTVPAPKVETTPPKKTPPPKKKAALPKKIDPPKPDPVIEPAQPPAAPAPKFGQILPAEQTREYSKRLDAALDRARSAMVLILGKQLTAEQHETAGRIRAFIAQAEQAREQDLQNAVSLAERADLLSRDLLDRLR